jgi:hypothetical protein
LARPRLSRESPGIDGEVHVLVPFCASSERICSAK